MIKDNIEMIIVMVIGALVILCISSNIQECKSKGGQYLQGSDVCIKKDSIIK